MAAHTATFSCALPAFPASLSGHQKVIGSLNNNPHPCNPLLFPSQNSQRCRTGSARLAQLSRAQKSCLVVRAAVEQDQKTKEEQVEKSGVPRVQDAEEVTKKYGLEAGLWQIFKSKDGEDGKTGGKGRGQQAKDLLAKYGVAYIGTSVALSLVSITVCYLLINSGVDVASLLEKVGIRANEQGEQVGTFALAYAAHKALSPVRFPPTVALTPVVANFFGKKPKESDTVEK